MLPIFESIVPIFLLIVVGNVLRRLPFIDDKAWPGLEQLGFWFLYPALLFTTVVGADFSGLQLDLLLTSLLVSLFLMLALTFAIWPVFGGRGISRGEFSSVFQTSVRWNGFMALAIAQKIFPPEGSAVVALAMAVIIVPINVSSVYAVTYFGNGSANWPAVMKRVATNPFIIAIMLGIVVRLIGTGLYGPVDQALDLVARAALGMGLLAIGAGLRPGDMVSPRQALWLPVVIKLVVFPAVTIALALAFGLRGVELHYLALCAAVPTAMNGYLMARQMGGDAELYAAVTTLQTAMSFFTIPVVLVVCAYISSA